MLQQGILWMFFIVNKSLLCFPGYNILHIGDGTMISNNDEDVIEIDLLRLMKALWRKAWLIILTAILGGALVLGGTMLFVTPTYKASVLMYVNSSDISVGGTKLSISQGELSAAKSLIETYAVILKTRTTLNDVIEMTGVDYEYEDLVEMIEAASVNSTEVFQIDVVTPDPAEATNIANTIALVLPEKIASIVEGSSARIVDMAVQPTEMDSPSYIKNTAIGALVGFLMASAVIVVLELMDDKIHDSDYLTQTYDLPILAVIPDLVSSQKDGYGYYKKPEKVSK